MQDKKELREHFSALRKAASNDVRDLDIRSGILSLDRVSAADTVLLYASFGSEVDMWGVAEKLLADGRSIAFPRCGRYGEMIFHTVCDLGALRESTGKYGICEPDVKLPCPVMTERTVCIVPGLAFTESGGRLGYGGGYYDRFLSANPQVYTVGAAYEAVITDSLPMFEHDIRINLIVTEERTVLCNE